jgi:hypothetical protein
LITWPRRNKGILVAFAARYRHPQVGEQCGCGNIGSELWLQRTILICVL